MRRMRIYRCGRAKLSVVRRQNIFGAEEHFFVEFFAGPQNRECNFDVTLYSQPGKPKQVRRNVHDSYWLAHIEQEYLTAPAKSSGPAVPAALLRELS